MSLTASAIQTTPAAAHSDHSATELQASVVPDPTDRLASDKKKPGEVGYNPGATFTKEGYEDTAKLATLKFVDLQKEVQESRRDNDITKALQASFYSNGCTMMHIALTPSKMLRACIKHDFRYTVGPNLYGDGSYGEGFKDRHDADLKLYDEAGRTPLASLAYHTLRHEGHRYYTKTDVTDKVNMNRCGDVVRTLQLTAIC
ncbi:hypothetical protein [Streptomyces syringium]|uniref:hypothetical protein n=1 Tax=Streptomyces syringium TaxID=76729 RepID=UPI0033FDF0B6